MYRLMLAAGALLALGGCTNSVDSLKTSRTFTPPPTAAVPNPVPVTETLEAQINTQRVFTDLATSLTCDPATGQCTWTYNSNPNAASQAQFGKDMIGAVQAGAALATKGAAAAAGVPVPLKPMAFEVQPTDCAAQPIIYRARKAQPIRLASPALPEELLAPEAEL